MKKRLGLARVLLHRPSILFLDVPIEKWRNAGYDVETGTFG
ncbi:hypothetical protein [Paenibacillus sp. PCH8]|nr:hypothetical protein [Paenibacillus sp. PCH8]